MIAAPATGNRAPASLRRRWLLVALAFGLIVVAGAALVSTRSGGLEAAQWALLVGAASTAELWLLWRGLPSNHRKGESDLFSSFGAANTLTIVRGMGLAVLAGFIMGPPPAAPWAPAAIYTVASALDFFDGLVARLTDRATALGEMLDIEFDSLGLLIVVCLGIWYEKLPAWYLVLGLSRYLFLAGIAWRRRRGLPLHELTPSLYRRLIAGTQVTFMSIMLWPIVSAEATRFASIWFGIPLALSFGRDWLVVSGVVDPGRPGYQPAMDRLHALAMRGLAPACRALAVLLAGSLLVPVLDDAEARTAAFAVAGWPWTATLAVGAGLIAVPMVALGILGRLAALVLMVPAAANMVNMGLDWPNGLLLAALIIVLHIGTGAWSLWSPDEALVARRAGLQEDS
jgi:CDP-diacylglycerol--glycerol-3-phosphate 3-phosphatidyltransferase